MGQRCMLAIKLAACCITCSQLSLASPALSEATTVCTPLVAAGLSTTWRQVKAAAMAAHPPLHTAAQCCSSAAVKALQHCSAPPLIATAVPATLVHYPTPTRLRARAFPQRCCSTSQAAPTTASRFAHWVACPARLAKSLIRPSHALWSSYSCGLVTAHPTLSARCRPRLLTARPSFSHAQADIWSCGVLLYVMLFVSFPFADPSNHSGGGGGGGPVNEAEHMRKVSCWLQVDAA